MHVDGPRAVGPHGKPVEASASTTASDVGDIWKSVSKNLKNRRCALSQRCKSRRLAHARSIHDGRLAARHRPTKDHPRGVRAQ